MSAVDDQVAGVRIVAISDTHNRAEGVEIPDGDVLVHGGDLTMGGWPKELRRAARWLGSLRSRFGAIVAIAGNHDFDAQRHPNETRALFESYGITWLQDSAATVNGLNFYGSPWQPWFYDWAFNFPREDLETGTVARATWANIPHDTDVLITHGPPRGILDKTFGGEDDRVGCPHLLAAIRERPSIIAHVFGHIHEGYGQVTDGGVLFVNAATCDRPAYAPNQPPIALTVTRASRSSGTTHGAVYSTGTSTLMVLEDKPSQASP